MAPSDDGASWEEIEPGEYVIFVSPVVEKWGIRCFRCGHCFETLSPGVATNAPPDEFNFNVQRDCPQCAAHCLVPIRDGKTMPDGITVYTQSDSSWAALGAIVMLARKNGWNSDKLADEIESKLPAHKQFAEWLRANQWFMSLSAAVIAPILTAVLAYLVTARDGGSHTEITNIVNEHITNVRVNEPPR